MRWAERWFALLLRLFPAGFRMRHDRSMRETFSPLAAGFLSSADGSRLVGVGRAFALGFAVVLAVGLAACTGPTIRALRVPPSEALRGEG